MKGQAMLFFLLMKGTSQRFGTKEAASLFDIFFFQTFICFLKPGDNPEACLGSEEKLSGTWS